MYLLDEYINVVANSSNIDGKFRVMIVTSSMIYNYQQWFPTYYVKTTTSIESRGLPPKDRQKFLISSYHYFECSDQRPGTIVTSEFINSIVVSHFCLRKHNDTHPLQMPSTKLYQNKNPINIAKMEDLKKLKTFIPEEKLHPFWNDLYEWPTI